MIQILPVEVRDQIAAGEVVERPAHLVKELIENSLDAGAAALCIRVKDRGRFVEIQDDGKGISSDQLSLALDRFATSKIQSAEDLWKLKTYGFRGEALASLAAVSRLTLISKPSHQATGAQIRSLFGQKSSVDSVSSENGTRLVVEDLFENVPARLKFLKTEGAEHQAIRQVVRAMAMIRPQVEFRYFENDRLVFVLPKTSSWEARVSEILEMKPLYLATDQTQEGWKVEILFAGPDQVAKTARQIWIYVQDRFVQDRALQTALVDAYRSLLMHGEYPVCAVRLQAPESEVDVNIHPTKSQVKFQDSSKAFRFVHRTLREALEKAPWIKINNLMPSPKNQQPMTETEKKSENLQFQDQSFGETHFRQKTLPPRPFEPSASGPWLKTLAKAAEGLEKSAEAIEGFRSLGYWSQFQVVGQVGLTYIVAQNANKVILVDQHAAHERVAFEKLMRAWQGGQKQIQEFLFPFAIDLTSAQVEALLHLSESFSQLGFELERLGPSTLGVKSGPAVVKERALPEIFEKTADEVMEKGGSFEFEKKLVDICATLACHSVVRAGQSLSQQEMKSLLEQMDEFPLSSFCPHGRPVSLEWSFEKLEKDFGRRV
jgi:DNA mismatch repair protein MutL